VIGVFSPNPLEKILRKTFQTTCAKQGLMGFRHAHTLAVTESHFPSVILFYVGSY
jgi:hypothetical protein